MLFSLCLILTAQLETGYCTSHVEWQFIVYPHQYQVDFSAGKLANVVTRELFEVRRLAFTPLMPMKVN